MSTRLPVLDNNVAYLPLVDPLRIGAGLEREFFPGAMLNAIYAPEDYPSAIQLTLYGMAGTLRSDFLLDFPLSLHGNLASREIFNASHARGPAFLSRSAGADQLPAPQRAG